jgi:hypothetical protein
MHLFLAEILSSSVVIELGSGIMLAHEESSNAQTSDNAMLLK